MAWCRGKERKEFLGVKTSIMQYMLLIVGVALLLVSGLASMPVANGAPLAALTPTAEPPTRTPLPPATSIPTDVPQPTQAPTDVPQPTETPVAQPPDGNPRANPVLTKSVSPAEAHIGDMVEFTLIVINQGNETADDVVVTDVLPDFLDVVDAASDKGTVAVDGRTVTVTIGPVAPGEVISIRIRAQVNAQALPPGGTNTARLATSSDSNDRGDDTASANVAILQETMVLVATPSATPEPTPIATSEQPPAAPSSGGAAGSSSPRAVGGAGDAPRPGMPPTGAKDSSGGTALLALLGLGAIVASLLIRRRGALQR
jgi:uncharacterized repeat protein (TIGR01451 family)